MFTVSMLSYPYNGLEPYIDETTMRIHHDKHHNAYVTKLNEALQSEPKYFSYTIEELLKNISLVPESLRKAVINFGGGHANHELFWDILTTPPHDGSVPKPSGVLSVAIDTAFDTFETFQEQLTKKALGRFGSGWAWLTVHNKKLEIVDTANQDSPLLIGHTPILGIDVWEHAYYLKYQNRRDSYIASIFNIIHWERVAKRYEAAIA